MLRALSMRLRVTLFTFPVAGAAFKAARALWCAPAACLNLFLFQEKLALQLFQHSPALTDLIFFSSVSNTLIKYTRSSTKPGKLAQGREKCQYERKCLSHTHRAPSAKVFEVIFGLLLPSAFSSAISRDRPTSSGLSPQC